MYRGKRISVVIPCHNEEQGIAAVLEQMPALVDEVVVVDNASTDRTAEVARTAGARVVYEARKGYGRAYKTGFAAARGDVVVTMDGDGTYPPDSIPLLLYVLVEERLDFISARRWRSQSGESKCFCTYECFLTINILFNPRMMPAVLKEWSSLKLRKAWRKLTRQPPARATLATCGTHQTAKAAAAQAPASRA